MYCGYEPNQMDAMDPAIRAAYTPMSDTRFEDLMPPSWNNHGFSQGTSSAAFLTGDVFDLADDGLSIKGAIIMPTGITTRYRGLIMGPDNALYATVDDGIIYRIEATPQH